MNIFSALAWPLLVLLHAWPSVTLALEKALVEVVIYEHSSGGDYTTHTYELEGKFSNAGAATSAEGDILEVSFLLLSMFSAGSGTLIEGEQISATISHSLAVLFISIRFGEVVLLIMFLLAWDLVEGVFSICLPRAGQKPPHA